MAVALGINPWVWTSPFTNASLGLLTKIKELGFDLVELPLEDPANLNAQEVRAALKATGLRATVCGAFSPTRDLTSDDPRLRQECLDYILAAMKLCEAIGAKVFAGPAYAATGKHRHVAPAQKKIEWERAVSGLQQAGRMAADHGVTIALETLNRFETDLINTCEQCLRLVSDIGLNSVGIHLDTFHMNIEEKSIYAAIKLAGAKLAHVHACENDRGAPGSGHVDWPGLAKGLREINYTGAAVIESFTPTCQAIAAATCIWRPLAVSQDALAADGLKFLRNLLK